MTKSDAEFLAELEARLQAATAAGDKVRAARLADQIARLRGQGGSALRTQRPGAMGLGTSTEDYGGKAGWTPPEKPDPMTAGHKPGGRRRR